MRHAPWQLVTTFRACLYPQHWSTTTLIQEEASVGMLPWYPLSWRPHTTVLSTTQNIQITSRINIGSRLHLVHSSVIQTAPLFIISTTTPLCYKNLCSAYDPGTLIRRVVFLTFSRGLPCWGRCSWWRHGTVHALWHAWRASPRCTRHSQKIC